MEYMLFNILQIRLYTVLLKANGDIKEFCSLKIKYSSYFILMLLHYGKLLYQIKEWQHEASVS
jgi:hypothetical protein